jgi:adenosylmethionine-8-amino-7-oxononanoate aminotransferase
MGAGRREGQDLVGARAHGAVPDIQVLRKGISGGYAPLAAVGARDA